MFVPKSANIVGLKIADLVAIAYHLLSPDAPNPAFEIFSVKYGAFPAADASRSSTKSYLSARRTSTKKSYTVADRR